MNSQSASRNTIHGRRQMGAGGAVLALAAGLVLALTTAAGVSAARRAPTTGSASGSTAGPAQVAALFTRALSHADGAAPALDRPDNSEVSLDGFLGFLA